MAAHVIYWIPLSLAALAIIAVIAAVAAAFAAVYSYKTAMACRDVAALAGMGETFTVRQPWRPHLHVLSDRVASPQDE